MAEKECNCLNTQCPYNSKDTTIPLYCKAGGPAWVDWQGKCGYFIEEVLKDIIAESKAFERIYHKGG